MAQITTAPAVPVPAKPPAAEDPFWRPLDDGGWELLAAHKFEDAREYFLAARRHLSSFPANDYRRGRTEAGLAWTRYRLTQQTENATPAELDAAFREAYNQAAAGAKLLREFKELPRQELIYRARAQHILGLCLIELCRGGEAAVALQSAAAVFSQAQATAPRYDVLQLLGKLLQCRRQFAEAVAAFRQIKDEATDAETQFRALVDLANTLVWMGHIRAAWFLQAEWRRLDARVRALPAKKRPHILLLRGQLLFARVNALYGDFAIATSLLAAADKELCRCGGKDSICRSVFWIISAELALEQGQLSCALDYLESARTIDDQTHLVDRGYSCLDLLAIDAGCRRCVVECCTHEYLTCWGACRPSCQVVFVTETTVTMQPIQYKEILLAIIAGLAGRIWVNAGQMFVAAELLQASREQLTSLIHPHTPLLFQIFVAQTQLAGDRIRPYSEVLALIQHLLSASLLMQEPEPKPGEPQPPPRQPTPYTLAYYREFLAETCLKAGYYEASEALWLEALDQSQQFRAAEHPVHVFLALRVAWTTGVFQIGPQPDCEERQAAQRAIQSALEKMRDRFARLQAVLGCDDYRPLVGRTLLTWLWFLACPRGSSLTELLQLEGVWQDRDTRLQTNRHLPQGKGGKPSHTCRDPRQGLAILGTVAVRLEFPEPVPQFVPAQVPGKPPPAPKRKPDPFTPYFELMDQHHVGKVDRILELGRLAELLEAAQMNVAAKEFRAAAERLQKTLPASANPPGTPGNKPTPAYPQVVQPSDPQTILPLNTAPAYGVPFRRWRTR